MAPTPIETKRYFPAKKQDGTVLHLQVRKPGRAELDYADREGSKAFNAALKGGLPTRTRQLKDIKASGVFTDADDAALEAIRQQLIKLEAGIADPKATADRKKELEEQRRPILQDFNVSRRDIEAMLSHTCDAKLDQAYRNTMLCCVVEFSAVDDKGSPVNQDKKQKDGTYTRLWPTVDALLNELDGSLIERAMYEQTMFNANLPSDWARDNGEKPATPEVKGDLPAQAEAPVTPPAPDAAPAPEVVPASAPVTPPAEPAKDAELVV